MICPKYKAALLAAIAAYPGDVDAPLDNINTLCDQERCAWWRYDAGYTGDCAVNVIAQALDKIREGLKK